MRSLISLAFAVITMFGAGRSLAEDAAANYPNRPIRIIVTFVPGGPMDVIARSVGPKLTEMWGQPVVVENRPGAGGNIGMDYVAKSPPDGYTLVVSSFGPLVISPFVYPALPYDPVKDLTPITLAATSGFIVAVNSATPVHSVQELIALAKAKPGELTFGSSGVATPSHLGGQIFESVAGINMIHVPYAGSGASVPALLTGEVQVLVEAPPLLLPLVKAGKLRALAVARRDRSPQLPDVPTVSEAGLAGAEVGSWYGFHAPAGTPQPIIDKLYTGIAAALHDEAVRARLATVGADVVASTPDEYRKFMEAEFKKWGPMIKASGIKVE
jgi:tripartite-type tricarboxylate transporter receptor subunit TctC